MRANNVAGQSRRLWLAALALAWALNLGAQSLSVDWDTVSAGGGRSASADGRYEVTDTVGQPEAGLSTATPYALEAGFIPGLIWQPLVNYGPTTWGPDGSYDWQMNQANGAAGSDPGWSLAVINGDLDIQATAGQPFTIYLETLQGEAPGPAGGFDYRNAYSWPMATVNGNILGFDAAKFAVDASGFANFLGGGTFRVERGGNTLNLTFTPHACSVSETTLGWWVVGNDARLSFTNQFGLSAVEGLTLRNCTMTGTAYGPGLGDGVAVGDITLSNRLDLPVGTTNLTIIAARTDLTTSATVNARLYDGCGNGRQFDPVLDQVIAGPEGWVRQGYSGLMAAEHYVCIVNGQPGLSRVKLVVNGKSFTLDPLTVGQKAVVDVAAAMNEGEQNTVVVLGWGAVGASAQVQISDWPSGTPLWMVPAVDPPRLHVERSGDQVTLSWIAPADFFILESSDGLGTGWRKANDTQEESEGLTTVRITVQGPLMLFRLRQ